MSATAPPTGPSPSSSGTGGLGRRSITATLWGTGGSAVRVVLQVASQVVLARLLGPETFGLYAVAIVIILLSSLFADVGLAYGLIQRPHVSNDDIRFVFTWQVILGLAVSLLLLVAAPLIARLYGDPRLTEIVAVLAPGCLINAAAATAGALLRREMDFKTINVVGIVAYAAGFLLLAIPLALAGAGVMSLVLAYLVQSLATLLMQYWVVRHSLRPLLWQPEAPGLLRFGLTVLVTNLLNWAMNGIDRAIVGSALGLSAAGLYATAYNLISAPLLTGLSLLQSVFYSASAKVQDDRAQLARGLRTLLGAVMLFAAPLFVGIAAVAETFFVTLYGTRWSGGGGVLAPLALAMPAFLVMGLSTPVLWAAGFARREFELQIPIAVAWVVVLWGVAQWGSVELLSWAVCALFYVRAAVIVRATLAAIGLAPAELLAACRAGLSVNAIVGLAALGADRAGAATLERGIALLALDVAACAIALLAGIWLVRDLIGEDVKRLFQQLAERIPGPAGTIAIRLLAGR
ncbi:MAG: oligosaccharide flippase family protein [Hyphomicrobiaceae bacterium]